MDLRDKKTKITFYHGMKTIGGTYIEVSYKGYSIYFDFGAEYNSKVDEKSLKGLDDILSFNLSPKLQGIYDRKIHDEEDELYKNKAVFVSHVHLDHSKMINYLDDQIPLYMSNDSKKLLRALNQKETFLFKNELSDRKTRDIIGLDYNYVINIGELEVEFVRVDHDGYGACGLIITSPDMKIAYTGDIRFHGYRPQDSNTFLEKAKNADILIMEGVSVSFDDEEKYIAKQGQSIKVFTNENDLVDEFSNIIAKNKDRQITFNYYEANIERIIKIKEVVEKYGRKLVLDEYYANILKTVCNLDIYYYCRENCNFKLNEEYRVEMKDLFNDKSNYLWQLPYEYDDFRSKLLEDSLYIHCDSSPLGPFDVNYYDFIESFLNNKVQIIELKCSGHASPRDLNKIIDSIKPKILIPIHSQKPEMLYNKYGDRILPGRKQTI